MFERSQVRAQRVDAAKAALGTAKEELEKAEKEVKAAEEALKPALEKLFDAMVDNKKLQKAFEEHGKITQKDLANAVEEDKGLGKRLYENLGNFLKRMAEFALKVASLTKINAAATKHEGMKSAREERLADANTKEALKPFEKAHGEVVKEKQSMADKVAAEKQAGVGHSK